MKISIVAGVALSALLMAGCECEKSCCKESKKESHLEGKAKISKEDAEKTALSKAPGGTIKEGELENEKGKLIWSFDIAVPGTKNITEVNVDAITGEIIAVEQETPKDQEKEKSDEAKEKKHKHKKDKDDDDDEKDEKK